MTRSGGAGVNQEARSTAAQDESENNNAGGGRGQGQVPEARQAASKRRGRTPRAENQRRRPWTDEEHRKFLEAYDAMVAVDPARRRWPNVAAAVGVEINRRRRRSHANAP